MKLQLLFVALTASMLLTSYGQIPAEGLSLWLRSDKGIQLEGTNVRSWKDQSSKGNHAFAVNEHTPQLIAKQLNGHPVIRFDGKTTGLETKPFSTFPKKRGCIFLVARVLDSSSTSGGGYGTFISTYFAKGVTWQMGATPDILYFYDGVGGSGFPYATIHSNDWLMLSLVRDDNNIIHFYRTGKRRTSFEVKNNQPDTNTLKIGFNGRLEVLNGDIAEIIIYDKTLSEAELNKVHSYLSGKYNIKSPAPPFYESWWFYSLMIIIGMAIIVFITKLVVQQSLKKKLKELERQREIDKERLRISREMHDDIGAGLTRIALMSEVAKHNSDPQELQQIADTSRQLVNSMSEIIWSLNPEYRSLGQLFSYLREELGKLIESSGIHYKISFPEDISAHVLSNELKRNILLVTKEIVHNAVKHSNARHLHISGLIEADILRITISDDGKGFDKTAVTGGNGMRNIKHRFGQLNASYSLDTAPGKGVIVQYDIPLK